MSQVASLTQPASSARVGTLAGRSTPIYAIGDSNCLVFGDLIYDENEFYEQYFVGRSKFIPGLRARDFVEESGELGQVIAKAMASEGLLIPAPDGTWQPFHQSAAESSNRIVEARGFSRTSPILVFFCGLADMHESVLRELAPSSDFNLPNDDDAARSCLPAYQVDRIVPYDSVLERCRGALGPLFHGLKRLRSLGFTNIFLHALPPPVRDDRVFREAFGFDAPVALRYKVTRVVNELFREFAQENKQSRGIQVVDNWSEIASGGALNPDFALGDKVHVNEKAAAVSMGALLSYMAHLSHVPPIRSLWEVASMRAQADYAQTRSSKYQSLAERFARESLVVLDCGAAFAQEIRDAVESEYSQDTRNRHLRLDWSGDPVEVQNPHMRSATPSSDVLDSIHDRLLRGELHEQISACMGSAFTIPQLKIYKSLVSNIEAGPQTYHRDGNPAGTLRGILYLVDVDEDCGPFEYIDDMGVHHKMTGPAGTLIVFDGKRYVHRATPPRASIRQNLDITFAVLVPGAQPLVTWPGMNNWPVDPYAFSTRGFRSSSGSRLAISSNV